MVLYCYIVTYVCLNLFSGYNDLNVYTCNTGCNSSAVRTSAPTVVSKGYFVHTTLSLSFGRDSKSRWSFIHGWQLCADSHRQCSRFIKKTLRSVHSCSKKNHLIIDTGVIRRQCLLLLCSLIQFSLLRCLQGRSVDYHYEEP